MTLVRHHIHRACGFTLIEMLIVVALIGVLAGIAYPAYTRHVERAHRAEARATLLEAAQYLERHYVSNNAYTGAVLPDRLQTVPAGAAAAAARYTLAVAVTDTTYTVTATPASTGDGCGNLTLDGLGVRSASEAVDSAGNADASLVAACWR